MTFQEFWGFWLFTFLAGYFMATFFIMFYRLFFDYDEERRLKINFKRDI